MSESLKKKVPAVVALVIVLVAAVAVSVYYIASKGGPHREGSYLFEIKDDGVNPGTEGPFPTTPPYVAPPTVPPPAAQ
jgi:PDZ domain-containing secreted protein